MTGVNRDNKAIALFGGTPLPDGRGDRAAPEATGIISRSGRVAKKCLKIPT
jgi:hypothetical protein